MQATTTDGSGAATATWSGTGNRRRSVRVAVDFVVRLTHDERITFTAAADLSLDGLFVHELVPFSVGTRVGLRFLLPGLDHPVDCSAEVVRERRAWEDGPGGCPIGNGCRFLDLAPSDRVAIRRFLHDRIF